MSNYNGLILYLLLLMVCPGDSHDETSANLGDSELQFWEAERECNRKNLSLPIATTYEEYTVFEEFVASNLYNDFWMGVYIPANAKQFKWLNNQTIQSFWKDDHPQEPEKRHCVVMDHGHFELKTEECDHDKYYICVNYALSESAFTLYRNKKYYDTARASCKNLGMDLVMIKTLDQWVKLTNYLKQQHENDHIGHDIWIGLIGFGEDKEDFNKFQWIDGEMMTTVDGKGFQVKESPEDKAMCVYYYNREWKEKSCDETKAYICFTHFTKHVSVDKQLSDYYDLINNQKPAPSTTPLIDTSFTRGALCAAECSKSYLCHMYTYNGSTHTCKTYKSAILVANNDPNLKFRLRRSV